VTVGSCGFPLPQAVVEADLVAVVGAHRHVAGGVEASGRFYCTAHPRDAGAGLAQQAESALRILGETLGAAGLSLGEAVMLTATLADIRALAAFETVFRGFFPAAGPARTVVAAPLAAPGRLVALECVAIRGGGTPVGAVGEAMLAGDILYIGGQLGAGDGIEAQTIAAWQRVAALVREAGMGLEDVISTNNVLADWRDYRGFNAGFARFVTPPYPPRATVSAGLADPAARVQVEAIAHRDGRNAKVIEVTTT
jgi:2-iminobutanoate/2-iminopropanoate deaminase